MAQLLEPRLLFNRQFDCINCQISDYGWYERLTKPEGFEMQKLSQGFIRSYSHIYLLATEHQ